MGLAPDTGTFDCADPGAAATFRAGALGSDLAGGVPSGSLIAEAGG